MLRSALLIIFLFRYSNGFIPTNLTDYDAYGIKIAMNEFIFVQVQNSDVYPTFLIQFSPYNTTASSSFSRCVLPLSSLLDFYVYTIVTPENRTDFFFAGEFINNKNGTFIGMAKYQQNRTSCSTSFTFLSTSFTNYDHQEFYVIANERQGRFIYGFSTSFIYIYDSENNTIIHLWNANLTYPDSTFMPHAVEFSDSFGIIAGFIANPLNTVSKYVPMIYLINFNSTNRFPLIVDRNQPNATADTWQDLLTNSDANTYSAKYDMSISINKQGEILIGMQFLNRVFLYAVDTNHPNQLNFISRNTGGRSIGNGKGVAWLDNGIAAILVNTYSFIYQWSSSQIFFYDIANFGYNSTSSALSSFPNNHQLLPLRFSPIILNIVSSPSSLALIDSEGNVLIINPTQSGYYPLVQDTGLTPTFTSPSPCLPGTYKNQIGVHDCMLCPSGTRNPGNASFECLSCSSSSYCSLGAVSDVPLSSFETITQVLAYPKSPESTIFDEILIQNMFNIGEGHCLVVSPLFWTLIVAGFVIICIILMGVLKIYISHPRAKYVRRRLKWCFRHVDLINEGEFWLGGLLSFCVIVLVSFAYAFSAKFLQQYPIETSSDSYFACDLSLRNAKFQTSIQSLSIPVTDEEKQMVNLLNNQSLTFNIDFVNTLMNCDVISLQALYGTRWMNTRWSECSNNNSILSLAIPLAYQQISIQIYLASVQTIGALRIGLSGHDSEQERYHLRELNFRQTFMKYGEIVATSLPITLELTKVINETISLTGEESDFGGIYIPTFTMDESSLFYTKDQYIQSTDQSTVVILQIHETPYYVKNVQEPIAKRSEIIFHNLLFITVCLEIFGLGFLVYKLAVKPLCQFFFPRCFPRKKHSHQDERELSSTASVF